MSPIFPIGKIRRDEICFLIKTIIVSNGQVFWALLPLVLPSHPHRGFCPYKKIMWFWKKSCPILSLISLNETLIIILILFWKISMVKPPSSSPPNKKEDDCNFYSINLRGRYIVEKKTLTKNWIFKFWVIWLYKLSFLE